MIGKLCDRLRRAFDLHETEDTTDNAGRTRRAIVPSGVTIYRRDEFGDDNDPPHSSIIWAKSSAPA